MSDDRLRTLAKRMRCEPALYERKLWTLLRERRLEGLKFRRQVVIGPYVADFVCMRHRLIVEADGPLHDAERDAVRDAWLASQGFWGAAVSEPADRTSGLGGDRGDCRGGEAETMNLLPLREKVAERSEVG